MRWIKHMKIKYVPPPDDFPSVSISHSFWPTSTLSSSETNHWVIVPACGAFTATSIWVVNVERRGICILCRFQSKWSLHLVQQNRRPLNIRWKTLGGTIRLVNCLTVPSERDSANGGTGTITFAVCISPLVILLRYYRNSVAAIWRQGNRQDGEKRDSIVYCLSRSNIGRIPERAERFIGKPGSLNLNIKTTAWERIVGNSGWINCLQSKRLTYKTGPQHCLHWQNGEEKDRNERVSWGKDPKFVVAETKKISWMPNGNVVQESGK